MIPIDNVKYPLRMKSKSSGIIVDFYSLYDCIIIESKRGLVPIVSKSRVRWTDEDNWERYSQINLKEIYANY